MRKAATRAMAGPHSKPVAITVVAAVAAMTVCVLSHRCAVVGAAGPMDSWATLKPQTRTTVANALWPEDAFPTTPELAPNSTLTIAYFNSSGGGCVTHIHAVLVGPPREAIQRNVALSITYDDAPFPSVFVPVGDFFGDTYATADDFENDLFAKRPVHAWHASMPMPYRKSIRIALVSATNVTIGGYSFVYHDDIPYNPDQGYFHAHFASNAALAFPWQPARVLPQEGIKGPGHLVGVSMVFASKNASAFPGTFEHVCEGNYEFSFDNVSRVLGNDTSVDPATAGYATSDHVVAILGSEDQYGYSYGWGADEIGLAKGGLKGQARSGTTVAYHGADAVALATYRVFDAPLRFSAAAWAQVNWFYDTGPGHNVPSNLCPAGTGCVVSYDVTTYMYLSAPRDASAARAQFPWPAPQAAPPTADHA